MNRPLLSKTVLTALMLSLLTNTAGAQSTVGALKGRVTLLDGAPVSGVSVSIDGWKDASITDGNGRFAIVDAAAGTRTVVIAIGTRVLARESITITASTETVHDFVVRPAQLRVLGTVRIVAGQDVEGMRVLANTHDGQLTTGKKSEVLLVDGLGANLAQNVARQVLGRVPGMNFSETENGGFPSSGIGLRGLSPTQSVEMNVRQNGTNIAADVYGYPETYYSPPLEAVDRIEVTRGASALQYGPQFGGVVNYVMRRGETDTKFAIRARQTTGSFGLLNSFVSAGGTIDGWRYYAFAQRRSLDGWRANSALTQTAGYGALERALSPTLDLRIDYSLLRNRLQMPGGLTDAEFERSAQQSFRSRNWLTSPWNVTTTTLDWRIAPDVRLITTTSYLNSERSLVWRNEDGGPSALDNIDPVTGTYVPREVGRERFQNVTAESRLLVTRNIFGAPNTVATGVRLFTGWSTRQGGGPGSTGSDFDLSLHGGSYGYDLAFHQLSGSAFIEDAISITSRLTLSPGVRAEWLRTHVSGYNHGPFDERTRERTVPLAGLATQYLVNGSTALYGNISQAYRPLTYDALTPLGSVSIIDPALHDAKGVTMDLGWRGAIGDRVRFDISAFRIEYQGRPGLVSKIRANGEAYTVRTNVADSRHEGFESYIEGSPFNAAAAHPLGNITLFNSLALIRARYASGEFRGNAVEQAPPVIERAGVTWWLGRISSTVQVSYTARSFADANNTVRGEDSVIGEIPAYAITDWSGSLRLSANLNAQFGVNNLFNRKYFTLRTDEYPGPGIIPASSRSVYLTISVSPAPVSPRRDRRPS
jgi:Fe(3+) dicitrate transport protein